MTKYKYDITQKDKIQTRQNTKNKQNTNARKLKKTKYKCDKTQKNRLQICKKSKTFKKVGIIKLLGPKQRTPNPPA